MYVKFARIFITTSTQNELRIFHMLKFAKSDSNLNPITRPIR